MNRIEPYGYAFQHEETGLEQVVDVQQVEWGFEKNNPRWKKIGLVYPQAALAAKDAEIARLEDELYDAQHGPWPEWAEKILKAVRSYSGYDGYDDATDGIDLVGEVEEALSELYSEAERLRAKLKDGPDAAL